MNRAFRLVWSKSLNALVVVSEITKGRGKGGQRSQAVTADAPREFGLTAIANAIRSALSGALRVSKGATVAMSAPVLISGAVSVGATLSVMSEASAQVAADVTLTEGTPFTSSDPSFMISGGDVEQNATIGNSNEVVGLFVDMTSDTNTSLNLTVTGVSGTIEGNTTGLWAEGNVSGVDNFTLILGSQGRISQTGPVAGEDFSDYPVAAVYVANMSNVGIELRELGPNSPRIFGVDGDGVVVEGASGNVTFQTSGLIDANGDGVRIDGVGRDVVATVNASGEILSSSTGVGILDVLGNVTFTNAGSIDTTGGSLSGVVIDGVSGSVIVNQLSGGEIKAGYDGIVVADVNGTVSMSISGNITAGHDAIKIQDVGNSTLASTATVTINEGALITASGADEDDGLDIRNVKGGVTVTNNGTVSAADSGILITGTGNNISSSISVVVNNNGNITSAAFRDPEDIDDDPSTFAIEVLGYKDYAAGLSNTNASVGTVNGTIEITNTLNITNTVGGGIGVIGFANTTSAYGLHVNNKETYFSSGGVTVDAGATLAKVQLANRGSASNITSVGDGIAIGAVTAGGGGANAYGVRSWSENNSGGASRGDILVEISNDGNVSSSAGRGIAIFADANASVDGAQTMKAVALWAENDVTVNITNSVGATIFGKEGGVFFGTTEQTSEREPLESFSVYSQKGDITIRVLNSGTIEANTTSRALSGSQNSPAAVLIEEVFAESGDFNLRINNEATGTIKNTGTTGAGIRIVGDPGDGEDFVSYGDASVRINNYGGILASNGEGVSVERIESNVGSAMVSVYNWGSDSRIHTSNGTALNIDTVRAQFDNTFGQSASVDVRNYGEISSNQGSAVTITNVVSESRNTSVTLINQGLIEGNISGCISEAAVEITSIGSIANEGGLRPVITENVVVDVVNTGTIRNLADGVALGISTVVSARGDSTVRVDNSGAIETNGSIALGIESVETGYFDSSFGGDAAVSVVNNGTLRGGIGIYEVIAGGSPVTTDDIDSGPSVWQQANAYAAAVEVFNGNGTGDSGQIISSSSVAIGVAYVSSETGPASVVVVNKGELRSGMDGISVNSVSSGEDFNTLPAGGEFDHAGYTDVVFLGRSAGVDIVNTGNITVESVSAPIPFFIPEPQVSVAGIRVSDVSASIGVELADANGSISIGDLTAAVAVDNQATINVTSVDGAAGIFVGSAYIPNSVGGVSSLFGPSLGDSPLESLIESALVGEAIVAFADVTVPNGSAEIGNLRASVDVTNSGNIFVQGEDVDRPTGFTPGVGIGVNGVGALVAASGNSSGHLSVGDIQASVSVRNSGEIFVDRSADSIGFGGEDSLAYGISVSNVLAAVVPNVSVSVGNISSTVSIQNTNNITVNLYNVGPSGEDSFEAAGIRVTGVAALAVYEGLTLGPSLPSANNTIASSGNIEARVVVNNSGAISVSTVDGLAAGIVVTDVIAADLSADTVGLSNVSATVQVVNSAPITISGSFFGGPSEGYGIVVNNVVAGFLGGDSVPAYANVSVQSIGGDIMVTGEDAGGGIVVGDVMAVSSFANASASVGVVAGGGNISVYAPGGTGIEVTSVMAEVNDDSIANVAVSVINDMNVTAENGISIGNVTAESNAGTANVTIGIVNNGSIAGNGIFNALRGIVVEDVRSIGPVANTDVSITNNGNINVTGNDSYGIYIRNIEADDDVFVTVTNNGTITSANRGVYLTDIDTQTPSGNVTFTLVNQAGGVIRSENSDAVYFYAIQDAGDANNVTLSLHNFGTISSVNGRAINIYEVLDDDDANAVRVTIGNNGTISSENSNAIRIDEIIDDDDANTVDVTVTNFGTISSNATSCATIFIDEVFEDGAADTVNVTVANSGTISSNSTSSAAINIEDIGDSGVNKTTVAINNLGSDSKILAKSVSERAIRIDDIEVGGVVNVTATVVNEGLIRGRVTATDIEGAFTFDNSGVWQVKDGSGDAFYADDVDQKVTIRNRAGGVIEIHGDSTLTGMNDFFNAGTVNVTADGGDFSVVDLTFSGSNFTAEAGSTFVIDAFLGNATASESDRFVFSAPNNVTITGTTTIQVVDAEPSVAGVNNPTGVVVIASVDDDGWTPNGAFVFDGGSPNKGINKGLWEYNLFAKDDVNFNTSSGSVDAGVGEDKVWRLASTPSNHAFELPVMMTAAQEAWHRSAQAMTERFSELRAKKEDDSSLKSGLWAKVIGGKQERDLRNTYGMPAGHAGAGGSLSFNTDYDQDLYGLLLGLDHVINTGDEKRWLLGLSAGSVRSNAKFSTTGTTMKNQITALGVYASYISDGLFVNAMIKQDSGDTDYVMSNRKVNPNGQISYSDSFDTKVFGGSLELGYRFLSPNGFIEPAVRIATAKAKIQDKNFLATDVDFGDGKSTRSSVSLTTGYTTTWHGSKAEPYLQVSLINESDATNSVRLISGGQSAVTVQDDEVGTLGQVAVGLRVFGSKSSHGFVRAAYTGNSDTKSYSLSGGLKWHW